MTATPGMPLVVGAILIFIALVTWIVWVVVVGSVPSHHRHGSPDEIHGDVSGGTHMGDPGSVAPPHE